MRKTLVVLAALAATLLGGGAVRAAPQSVTISLSRPSVVYGGSISLSGKVSNSKAGETVDVLAEAYGASSFSTLGSVSTTAGGKWADVVKPTLETAYHATWKSATSPTVTVKVRPLITLTLINLSTGRFSTKATAAAGAGAPSAATPTRSVAGAARRDAGPDRPGCANEESDSFDVTDSLRDGLLFCELRDYGDSYRIAGLSPTARNDRLAFVKIALLLLAALAAPLSAAEPTEPVPIQPIASLITTEDYPADALKDKNEGLVRSCFMWGRTEESPTAPYQSPA